MQNKWYPIIDYEKCVGCLSCVEFCPHNVFTVEKGLPIVSHPENCVEFCRGCQKGACDHDAISFPGDKKLAQSGIDIDCNCESDPQQNTEKEDMKNE